MRDKEPLLTFPSIIEEASANDPGFCPPIKIVSPPPLSSTRRRNPYVTHDVSPRKKLAISSTGVTNPYAKRPNRDPITPCHEPISVSPSESDLILQSKFTYLTLEPLFDCRFKFISCSFSLGQTEFADWCRTPSTRKYIGLLKSGLLSSVQSPLVHAPTNPNNLRTDMCLCSTPCLKGSLHCPYQKCAK